MLKVAWEWPNSVAQPHCTLNATTAQTRDHDIIIYHSPIPMVLAEKKRKQGEQATVAYTILLSTDSYLFSETVQRFEIICFGGWLTLGDGCEDLLKMDLIELTADCNFNSVLDIQCCPLPRAQLRQDISQ